MGLKEDYLSLSAQYKRVMGALEVSHSADKNIDGAVEDNFLDQLDVLWMKMSAEEKKEVSTKIDILYNDSAYAKYNKLPPYDK